MVNLNYMNKAIKLTRNGYITKRFPKKVTAYKSNETETPNVENQLKIGFLDKPCTQDAPISNKITPMPTLPTGLRSLGILSKKPIVSPYNDQKRFELNKLKSFHSTTLTKVTFYLSFFIKNCL